MNWSVWRLSVLFLLNTTPSSHPYSFLIRLTSINSSLHSKMKRVNALLETSLHHPLCLPCPVVDSTSKETAMKSAKHLKLLRNSCKSASVASRGRSKAKDAKDADTTTSESAQGKTAQIEFAGHASALSSSTCSQ